MVQLKLDEDAMREIQKEGFNSCMVQLKFTPPSELLAPLVVLIPVWCN